MKVERSIFAHSVQEVSIFVTTVTLDHTEILHLAVDLVGRGIDEEAFRTLEADGFEQIEGTERVDFEVLAGIGDRSGYRDLRGEVQNCLRSQLVDDPFQRIAVTDVGAFEANLFLAPQPVEILRRPTSREIVEDGDRPAPFVKVSRRIDANEAGASGDQY